ncbi:hypothetical protein TT_C0095 [Thermus thermophilus HB27]|uniref:Uncharacterized protein n=1 Tax=Thermus thermophilus (strain ATCC BAA-163 / DSM 7039 / HB27) TaxID=262724 RepID=Q72LG4_THET2|nr:hypothetical protein TT_C0095 [Thermus thermophilus HB27]
MLLVVHDGGQHPGGEAEGVGRGPDLPGVGQDVAGGHGEPFQVDRGFPDRLTDGQEETVRRF